MFKNIALFFLLVSLTGCAPLVFMTCRSTGLEYQNKRVEIGISSDELVKSIGKPSKVKKSSGQEAWIYYTGRPRYFLIGLGMVGREQYHFIFRNNKLMDIIYYSSANGAWSKEDFCSTYAE